MATEFVYLKGKVKWFRHNAPDTMFQPPRWKHTLYLDKDSLEKFKELQKRGIKNHLKKDDDGYFVIMSRPTNVMRKGKVVGMEPPVIVGADGKTRLVDTQVGNGSDVTTKLEVYNFDYMGKKGIAARWASSRIDNLVPFEGKRDFNADEADQVKGLLEQPAPEW